MDTTYNTNRFRMMLSIVTVIDNNFRTRIVTCAIIEDETLDTYRWILDNIITETGITPKVVYTDSNPSIMRSINDIFPSIHNLLCIFHIDLNIRKNADGFNW